MSWQSQLSTKLKRVRVHYCPFSNNAKGVRKFLRQNYPDFKQLNPSFSMPFREFRGIEPQLYVYYDYGRCESFPIANLSNNDICNILKDCVVGGPKPLDPEATQKMLEEVERKHANLKEMEGNQSPPIIPQFPKLVHTVQKIKSKPHRGKKIPEAYIRDLIDNLGLDEEFVLNQAKKYEKITNVRMEKFENGLEEAGIMKGNDMIKSVHETWGENDNVRKAFEKLREMEQELDYEISENSVIFGKMRKKYAPFWRRRFLTGEEIIEKYRIEFETDLDIKRRKKNAVFLYKILFSTRRGFYDDVIPDIVQADFNLMDLVNESREKYQGKFQQRVDELLVGHKDLIAKLKNGEDFEVTDESVQPHFQNMRSISQVFHHDPLLMDEVIKLMNEKDLAFLNSFYNVYQPKQYAQLEPMDEAEKEFYRNNPEILDHMGPRTRAKIESWMKDNTKVEMNPDEKAYLDDLLQALGSEFETLYKNVLKLRKKVYTMRKIEILECAKEDEFESTDHLLDLQNLRLQLGYETPINLGVVEAFKTGTGAIPRAMYEKELGRRLVDHEDIIGDDGTHYDSPEHEAREARKKRLIARSKEADKQFERGFGQSRF